MQNFHRLTCGVGLALLSVILVTWFRDLIQLLRGRLGDPRTPHPYFWLLLGLATFGGGLGLHRWALRRRWSAPLFPLLFGILAFAGSDAVLAYTGWRKLQLLVWTAWTIADTLTSL